MTVRRTWSRILLILLCSLWASSASAEAPSELAWADLTVRLPAAENPFASLSLEQLEALIDVAAVRDRKARGVNVSPLEGLRERAATAGLERTGVDVDRLLARRSEIGERQRALATAVNPAVDGKLVRLPGYLLPLELSGTRVTEFLLVPWVGACIHTPPPPPNQIVHVKADRPYALRGTFDAVWVTGRLATSAGRKSVYITDGSGEVETGYAMRATHVEPYRP
jgi:hypothetical protein